MNRFVKKIICVASTIALCGMYTLPIYAISEETLYCKMNNIGEVYKSVSNGEESKEEMPIETEIKYYLNEEEISFNDIKGKPGKARIEINYKNKEKKTVEVNGKQETMYVPYIVACGMILDNEKFQNTTISSGKIIDNGSNTVAIGIAMPGMQESLDLEKEDIEIPEKITIETEATDFELGNIYMYVESDVFDTDSLDFLDEFESIYEDCQKLKDASRQLVEGSKSLKEGTTTYAEKFGEFNQGLSQYTSGVSSVNSNYTKISDGISTIDTNTKKIAKGSSSLASGITELKTNLSTLISAMSQIKQGTDGIYDGVGQMINSVDSSITKITTSTSESSSTVKTLTSLGTATETSIYKLNATKSALEKTVSTMEESEEKTALLSEIASLEKQITELKINVGAERSAYNKAMKEETNEVITGLKGVKTALQKLQGVSLQVKNGVDTIVKSSPKLQSGLRELEDGSKTLSQGANELSSGSSTLSSGAKELKAGIETLNSSTGSLVDAGNQLKDGADTLSTGANTLASGMKEFDNSGINTIYNLVNGDLRSVQSRTQKLMDLAKKDDNSSSYKYILKVDSLKK